MKNTLIVVFALTTIALGAVCIVLWQELAEQKTSAVALRAELEQKARETADLQAAQSLSEKQRQEVFQQADDLARKLQARQQTDAKAPAKAPAAGPVATEGHKPGKDNNPFGGFLAKMMEDPDTRKMIREQQRVMLDQLYSPLIKKLDLSPEDASRFKDLLADNMMKSTEKASSLLGATNRAEMASTLAAEQKDFEEQVRGFLGESRYAQYKDYQQSVGERAQLNQFRMQNAGENALTDQQTERLLGYMRDEKLAVASAAGLPAPGDNQDPANVQAMMSGEGIERLLQSQETVNQRVYERARETLSAEQLAAFGRYQTNQLQMMRMGMSMARKFMAPENPPAEPPRPGP